MEQQARSKQRDCETLQEKCTHVEHQQQQLLERSDGEARKHREVVDARQSRIDLAESDIMRNNLDESLLQNKTSTLASATLACQRQLAGLQAQLAEQHQKNSGLQQYYASTLHQLHEHSAMEAVVVGRIQDVIQRIHKEWHRICHH
jgi:hypothetical protein